jgi:hypothetical protein
MTLNKISELEEDFDELDEQLLTDYVAQRELEETFRAEESYGVFGRFN